MKEHPQTTRPEPLAAISKRTGTARQTLRKWRDAEGVNIYDEADLQARIAGKQPCGKVPSDTEAADGGESMQAARLRRERALADLAESKAATARAELVPIATVRESAARIGAATKTALLRLNAEIPTAIEGMTASQAHKVISAATDAILRDLSDASPDFWR